MHNDDIRIEKTSLERDIRTMQEILPAVPQNLFQETLLAFSNVSVAVESLKAVNKTKNYPCFAFPNTVVQAKYLKTSKEKMTFVCGLMWILY